MIQIREIMLIFLNNCYDKGDYTFKNVKFKPNHSQIFELKVKILIYYVEPERYFEPAVDECSFERGKLLS
jgi:hypothetical protein